MVELMLKPDQELVLTKYFTAIVKHPPDKRYRQAVFLQALRTLDDFQIYYGHFLWNTATCKKCGHSYPRYHEKMTDVNIATELLTDAFQDEFDTALLYSADGDLSRPLTAVTRLFPKKLVVIAFPPKRSSKELRRVATACTNVSRNVLAKSVFPNPVIKRDGSVLQRPKGWK
jgi:uncharacterized LabA/DUF88 family protein